MCENGIEPCPDSPHIRHIEQSSDVVASDPCPCSDLRGEKFVQQTDFIDMVNLYPLDISIHTSEHNDSITAHINTFLRATKCPWSRSTLHLVACNLLSVEKGPTGSCARALGWLCRYGPIRGGGIECGHIGRWSSRGLIVRHGRRSRVGWLLCKS